MALTEEEIQTVFSKLDTDGNGSIDADEFAQATEMLGTPITRYDALGVFRDAHCDNNTMSYSWFKELMMTVPVEGENERTLIWRVTTHKYFVRTKLVFTFLLAIYTMFSLWTTLTDAIRTDLALSKTPPTDRCVPFFDHVKAFASDNPFDTEVLYDYQLGDAAIVRVCTDLPNETVVAAIGNDTYYSPFHWLTDCDPLNHEHDRADFLKNCIPEGVEGESCEELLDIFPRPQGINWRHSLIEEDFDGAVKPYPPSANGINTSHFGNGTTSSNDDEEYNNGRCSVKVSRVDGIDICNRSVVASFASKTKHFTTIVTGVAVLMPVFVFLFQVYLCIDFIDHECPDNLLYNLAFALEGIPGPIFRLYWFLTKRDAAVLDELSLTSEQWLWFTFQDVVEGLVAPIVAVWGCRLDRFKFNVLLIAFKCIKISSDSAQYWSARHATATSKIRILSRRLLESPSLPHPPEQDDVPASPPSSSTQLSVPLLHQPTLDDSGAAHNTPPPPPPPPPQPLLAIVDVDSSDETSDEDSSDDDL